MDGSKIVPILDTLSREYVGGAYPGRNSQGVNPDWPCDPFHVLISTILSQRTKDDNTRKASDSLFAEYDSVDALAEADPGEVAELIRPAGFPRQKADAIVRCCRVLRDEYGGEVPESTEELVSLPMVGRKTAACVRSYAMGIPSVCVDTHVHRIANLMGLVHTRTPEETEEALMDITPRERWSDINRYLVRHGQVVCLPNHPRCDRCSVSQWCDHYLSGHDRGHLRHFKGRRPHSRSMHEVSVVTSLVDAVIQELSKYDVERVNAVTVLIGEMTSLGEEQMTFAYDIVTEGTILEGSRLIIERVPVEVECQSCGYRGPVRMLTDPDYESHSIPIMSCPECGGAVRVVKGMECAVKCMDIEEVDGRCRVSSSTGTRRPRRGFWST